MTASEERQTGASASARAHASADCDQPDVLIRRELRFDYAPPHVGWA